MFFQERARVIQAYLHPHTYIQTLSSIRTLKHIQTYAGVQRHIQTDIKKISKHTYKILHAYKQTNT